MSSASTAQYANTFSVDGREVDAEREIQSAITTMWDLLASKHIKCPKTVSTCSRGIVPLLRETVNFSGEPIDEFEESKFAIELATLADELRQRLSQRGVQDGFLIIPLSTSNDANPAFIAPSDWNHNINISKGYYNDDGDFVGVENQELEEFVDEVECEQKLSEDHYDGPSTATLYVPSSKIEEYGGWKGLVTQQISLTSGMLKIFPDLSDLVACAEAFDGSHCQYVQENVEVVSSSTKTEAPDAGLKHPIDPDVLDNDQLNWAVKDGAITMLQSAMFLIGTYVELCRLEHQAIEEASEFLQSDSDSQSHSPSTSTPSLNFSTTSGEKSSTLSTASDSQASLHSSKLSASRLFPPLDEVENALRRISLSQYVKDNIQTEDKIY